MGCVLVCILFRFREKQHGRGDEITGLISAAAAEIPVMVTEENFVHKFKKITVVKLSALVYDSVMR